MSEAAFLLRRVLAAVAAAAAILLLVSPAAFADNTYDGYQIHWLGVGSEIAVCPAGDTLSWRDIPGKEYAPGVPAQQVTCYLPDGAPDRTPPWEGKGVPEGPDHRLFPPPSAIGQAPWIADLANLGRVQGIPTPADVVSSAINGWLSGSASNLDTGMSGFFGTMTSMPLLVNIPLVRDGFALSFVLALIVGLGKLAADMRRWAQGDPKTDKPDWRVYVLLGGVMFGGPLAMDTLSVVTNAVIAELWRSVLNVPVTPSGLRLMQVVTGGSGGSLFPVGAALSIIGGILYILLSFLLLFVLGIMLEACVLIWLAVGAFAPLLVLWGMWNGGIDSPQMRRITVAVGRTYGFHTLIAIYWLMMYAAASAMNEALGMGGQYVVLLLGGLAVVGGLFYWALPVVRALAGEADEWDQWAARAERLLVRIGIGTRDVRWAEAGAQLRGAVGAVTEGVRSAARAPDRAVSALPHVRGGELLERYEKVVAEPGSLVRWVEKRDEEGHRYYSLEGQPEAVAFVRREFASSVPLVTEDRGGEITVPGNRRADAERALADSLDGVLVYWESPLGPVTLRGGSIVRIARVPQRAICLGKWGS
jgi:hypothetical protein